MAFQHKQLASMRGTLVSSACQMISLARLIMSDSDGVFFIC